MTMRDSTHSAAPHVTEQRYSGAETVKFQSALALCIHKIHQAMSSEYSKLLNETVFVENPSGIDRKEELRFRKELDDNVSRIILTIIWKESDYISSEDLKRVGMKKFFTKNNLTAHGLATEICKSAKDLGKTVNKIREVSIAGSAFNLVDRNALRKTKVELRGTRALNEFMIRLAHDSIKSVQRDIAMIFDET